MDNSAGEVVSLVSYRKPAGGPCPISRLWKFAAIDRNRGAPAPWWNCATCRAVLYLPAKLSVSVTEGAGHAVLAMR